MPQQRRLLLFAKRPRLGKVKSRLTPPYTPAEALQLYRAMLQDLSAMLEELPQSIQVEWWWDGEPEDKLDSALPPDRARSFVQQGETLGCRLNNAFARSAGPTAALGGDCALVDQALIEAAFSAVESSPQSDRRRRAAIAPAEDGGYLLIACSSYQPELFEEIPWGGPDVFAQTCHAAERAKIELQTLPRGFDIDDAESVERLIQLSKDGKLAGRLPATLGWLKSQGR